MPIPLSLMQVMAQSAYPGKTSLNVGRFKLFRSTPTLKFYHDGKTIVVAIRGTVLSDSADIRADGAALVGALGNTDRYQKDLKTLLEVQEEYPPTEFRYIAVAHSLGGAILDRFLRAGLIRNGLSYNPLPEPQELRGNPLHRRIYHKEDFIYKAVGHLIPGVEVRRTFEPFWKYFAKHFLPFGLGDLFTAYDRHKIRTFKGGAAASAPRPRFRAQLEKIGITPEDYLAAAREAARKHSYDSSKLVFSDNTTHKLQMESPDGHIRRFGRVGNNDFLLWSRLERDGKAPSGTSEKKRRTFLRSHSKIKGDWKDDKYSPNWLAMNILW